MPTARRITLVLAGAAAFGLFVAWAKGPGSGALGVVGQTRAAAGNLSAPWLVLAFVAGAQARRLRSGAALGLAATLVALAAFYVLTTALVDLGGHGALADLRLELEANRGYFEGGLLSGPLLGVLGAWWHRRPTLRASLLAGGLMMAEPLVLAVIAVVHSGVLGPRTGLPLIVRMVPGWTLTAHSGATALAVYGTEFVLGLLLVGATAARLRSR